MALANNNGASVNGISQEYLLNYIIYLHGIIDGFAAKLDADAGTGLNTNYAAAVRASLPVAAGLSGGETTVTAVSAAVVAYS